MPKTTYSQRSLTNRQPFFYHQSVRKTKRKSKIHKKKYKTHYNSAKNQGNKNCKKSNTILRYKSAYSPEYTIQIHDIEMSSFHSDEVGPRFPLSQDQIDYKGIDTMPLANQPNQQIYRRFHEDYERRDLQRIMRGCQVTEKEQMVD